MTPEERAEDTENGLRYDCRTQRMESETVEWNRALIAETIRQTIAEETRAIVRHGDALRVALREAHDALNSLWAAIGDALMSGNGIEKAYAQEIACEVRTATERAQAALDSALTGDRR